MIGSPLRAPTQAQEMRWLAIRDLGCLACRLRYPAMESVPCDIHHLTIGGHHGAPRRGHDETIGLCQWHHVGKTGGRDKARLRQWAGPSYAEEPVEFRAAFGDDDYLLAAQNELIAAFLRSTSIFQPCHEAASA